MSTVAEIIEDYGEVWPKYCRSVMQRPMPYTRDPSRHLLRQVNELTKSAIKIFGARQKDKKGAW
jgi:hypothetical protein